MISSSKIKRKVAVAAVLFGLGFATAAEAKTIALVTINQQALFFNQINDGAKAAADKAGAKLVIFNANNQAAAQNSAIENYITQKVDGIVLVAIDVNGVKPADHGGEERRHSGRRDRCADSRRRQCRLHRRRQQGRRRANRQVLRRLRQRTTWAARPRSASSARSTPSSRTSGSTASRSAAQVGADVTFLDTVDGQNIQDVALTASENLMTANPDMKAIYATGEPALIGAISAVTSQKRTDKVKVFGWDLTAQAIKGIDEGWIVAVVQQDPYQEGEAGGRDHPEDQEGREDRTATSTFR